MIFDLPKTVEIDGELFDIRYDFRVVLEILVMLCDPELSNDDKAEALINMFYCDPETVSDVKKAVDACYKFIDMGSQRPNKKSPRLTDWKQDYEYIIAPVNRVLGYEARAVAYDIASNTGGVHWWTFMSAYMEIGSDCLFSQIVSIRDKQARGKKLEKNEREWLRRNGDLVKIKTEYTSAENSLIGSWTKGVVSNG